MGKLWDKNLETRRFQTKLEKEPKKHHIEADNDQVKEN